MKRVVFLGDSITDANRDKHIENEGLGSGYALMVAGELGCHNLSEYEFLNRGNGGNNVVDLYARIKKDVWNLKPDILSILIGVNDVWSDFGGVKNGVDEKRFEHIYRLIIEETKESYYDTLEKSSTNWHNNENDYSYFVEYYLGIILNAYKEFDSRINIVENKKITAYDRIIDIFKDNIIPIDKAFITNKCPDLSETTIERTLNKLLKEDKIVKISGGRYTKYKWNN